MLARDLEGQSLLYCDAACDNDGIHGAHRRRDDLTPNNDDDNRSEKYDRLQTFETVETASHITPKHNKPDKPEQPRKRKLSVPILSSSDEEQELNVLPTNSNTKQVVQAHKKVVLSRQLQAGH